MINLEREKDNFKNHVAKLSDYGNVKVLDFKNPDSNNYRIRFIFEEDYCRLHISGDLGSLSATNYNNMTFEGFEDFVGSPSYFKEKIDCIERPLYFYYAQLAEKELKEHINYATDLEGEELEDAISEVMNYWVGGEFGLESGGYNALSEYDPDAFEYFDSIGREDSGILDLYLMAYDLAVKQLKEGKNE